jgi:hypothetical protein
VSGNHLISVIESPRGAASDPFSLVDLAQREAESVSLGGVLGAVALSAWRYPNL